jgi:MFS family permease
MLARPLVGKMTDKIGARFVVMGGIIFAIVGTLPFVFFDKNASMIFIIIALMVRGIGMGGVTLPMMSDAYTGMPKIDMSAASVGTRIMQNIGGAFGSAVLATVVSLSIADKMPTVAHMTVAYHDGFLLTLVLSVVLLLPALLLTHRQANK